MAETPDFSGKWHNQNGSELEVHVGSDGRLGGSFRSAVGSVRHGQAFAVAGWCSGDLIGFCVRFDGVGVAAWTGQHTVAGGVEKLQTLWQLAHDIPAAQERDWLWSGVRTGADEFLRGPSLRLA